MSEFEFFFTFYGLVLGLAAAEVLNGLGGVVRARRLGHVGVQTALLTTFLMVAICATWVDAWTSLREVKITLGSLAAPLGIAGCYYLAAVILFPRDLEDWASLDAYYTERKRYAAILILVAELLVTITFWDTFTDAFSEEPNQFWRWLLPYNLIIKGLMIALILVRGRRANIGVLLALIAVFLLPYWAGGWADVVAAL